MSAISSFTPSAASATADTLLIGESPAMAELRRIVRQVAPTSASVMLTGPSGSGKEVVARAIQAESRRATRTQVAVNCGAIPRELLESELFGHEKGSFTGAFAQRRGRFEEAHGGTLFLDEIGDMPLDMQVKLLRVLEDHTITRVGGAGQIAVDTRIICATHRDIEQEIEAGRFREDLFYRLSVFPINVPSLADRREDIPLLVRHFVRQGVGAQARFSPTAMARLADHRWPGNVRELRNVIERAAILYGGETIGAEQVETILYGRGRMPAKTPRVAAPAAIAESESIAPQPLSLVGAGGFDSGPVDLRNIVADIENRYITEALRMTEGVVAEAARLLSLKRTTLIEKMRKHGVAEAA